MFRKLILIIILSSGLFHCAAFSKSSLDVSFQMTKSERYKTGGILQVVYSPEPNEGTRYNIMLGDTFYHDGDFTETTGADRLITRTPITQPFYVEFNDKSLPADYECGKDYYTSITTISAYTHSEFNNENNNSSGYVLFGKVHKKHIKYKIHVDKDCVFTVSQAPVVLATGEKLETATDINLNRGAFSFEFTRKYTSVYNKRMLLGYNWESNWERRIYMEDLDHDGIADLLDPNAPSNFDQINWTNYESLGNNITNKWDSLSTTGDQDGDGIPASVDCDDNDKDVPHQSILPTGYPYHLNHPDSMGSNSIDVFPLDPRRYGFGFQYYQPFHALTFFLYKGNAAIPFYYFGGVTDTDVGGMRVTSQYVSPVGSNAIFDTSGWTHSPRTVAVRYSNGTIDTYYGMNYPPQITDGHLLSSEDAQGNKTILHYDALGRIQRFMDKDERLIATLNYYDDPTIKDDEKANLLKSITDAASRTVSYDYDIDGNLVSVNKMGRITRYDYYASDLYNGSKAELRHNLRSVYEPQSVADNPTNPVPKKRITYEEGMVPDYDRVKSETLFYAADGQTTLSTIESFASVGASQADFEDNENSDYVNRTVTMTRHTLGSGEQQDYYFNVYGETVKTVRRNGTQAYITNDTVNTAGTNLAHTGIDGRTGHSECYKLDPWDFGGLGQCLLDKVTSTTQAGCGCSGGTPQANTINYSYEPLTGEWRTKTENFVLTTTRVFDYQEMSTDTAKVLLARKLFGLPASVEPTTTQSAHVVNLLRYLHIPMNLGAAGDVNGDGVINQCMGNVIKETLPPAIVPKLEGDETQLRAKYTAYYDSGHAQGLPRYEIDEFGVLTYYEYDANGRLATRVEDADYLSAGCQATRPQGLAAALNARWEFMYDLRGNQTSETNPRGVRTDNRYDLWDELIETRRAAHIDYQYNTQTPEPEGDHVPPLVPYNFIAKNSYDANGRLIHTELEDRGETTNCGPYVEAYIKYDLQGRRIEEGREYAKDQFEITKTYYDANGRIVLTVQPNGVSTYNEYNLLGQLAFTLTGLVNPNADAQLPAASRAKILYSGSLPTSTLASAAKTISYAYNDKGQLASRTENGLATLYEYDDQGRKSAELIQDDPLGYRIELGYDIYGKLTDIKMKGRSTPSDNVAVLDWTNYQYDEAGRLKQTNHLLGTPQRSDIVRTTNLSSVGSAIQTLKPMPIPSGYVGWLASRTIYDPAGRVTQTIEDDGTSATLEYDALGRVTYSRSSGGNAKATNYDSVGNAIETQSTHTATTASSPAQTLVTTTFYDALNQPLIEVDNAGHARDWRWTSLGQLAGEADANGSMGAGGRQFSRRIIGGSIPASNGLGNLTLYKYDGLGRRLSENKVLTPTGIGNAADNGDWMQRGVIYPQSKAEPFRFVADPQRAGNGLVTTTNHYLPGGWPSALTDDNDNVTSWTYDSQGRKLTETLGARSPQAPNNLDATTSTKTKTWVYGVNGQVRSFTRADGSVLWYTYDYGRLTKIASDEAGNSPLQTYGLDGLGRRTGAIDYNGSGTADDVTLAVVYDSLGRVVEERTSIGGAAERVVSKSYTSTHLGSLEYPNERLISYIWENAGRLAAVRDGGSGAASLASFDYLGDRPLGSALGNGLTQAIGYAADTGKMNYWVYKQGDDVKLGWNLDMDRGGRRRAQRALHDAADSQHFTFDSVGRLTSFARVDLGAGGNWPLTSTALCSSEITAPAAGVTQSQEWTLDGSGNWKSCVTQVNDTAQTQARGVNNLNEYATVAATALGYDARGNLINDGSRWFGWDMFNRLTAVTDTTGPLVNYIYDAWNRPVGRVPAAGRSVVAQQYVYAGSQRIEWYEGGNTANPKQQVVYCRENGDALLQDVNQNVETDNSCVGTEDLRLYLLAGPSRSVAAVANGAGQIVQGFEYDPYGACWLVPDGNFAATARVAVANTLTSSSLLFAGMPWDEVLALVSNGQRVFSPALGRFLSMDSAGFIDGPNLYQYAGGNPVDRFDFAGMWGVDVHRGLTAEVAVDLRYMPSAASVIGDADQSVDEGLKAPWFQRSRHMPGGKISLETWYSNQRAEAIKLLKKNSCEAAAAAFGEGLHSYQDITAHRRYPGWPEIDNDMWIAHPSWWDTYWKPLPVKDDSISLPGMPYLGIGWKDNKWHDTAVKHKSLGSDYDYYYATPKNIDEEAYRAEQIMSQVQKIYMVESDTQSKLSQFRSDIENNGCECKHVLLYP
jgi:RHS repeat-associated protein